MPPKITGNNNDHIRNNRVNRHRVNHNKNKDLPKAKPVAKDKETDRALFDAKLNERKADADRQRERLERFITPGITFKNAFNEAFKSQSFRKADRAYSDVISDSRTNFSKYGDIPTATNRAVDQYNGVLSKRGVDPLYSRKPGIQNAVDFLKTEANRSGGLFTVDGNLTRSSALSGEKPQFYVRMLSSKYLDNPDSRLGRYDSGGKKTIAWATTVEDLAGTRLDYKEVMSRIGWTADEIAKAKPGDNTLAIFTSDAAIDPRTPTNDAIISQARNDTTNFGEFPKKDSFWQDVVNLDYQASKNAEKAAPSPKNYFDSLLPEQQTVFQARQQMDDVMGVNPLFTGDGTTQRPDAVNNKVGGREYIVNNAADDATLLQMAEKGQVAFVDLQDLGTTPKTPVEIASNRVQMPEISRGAIINSEMKQGGLIGGATSAATSLPQVFDQVRNDDYVGAATTLATNTGIGTAVGSLSAGGERIIANSVDDLLSNSSRQILTSGGRQIISRAAGSSAIGGIVNGVFSSVNQVGAYKRGEVTGSQAIGTVTGEVAVGAGAGLAGAAAGAAIGSIIPVAGTIVGGVIGFGVGMAAGYFADKGMRSLGVNTAIAGGVTSAIDNTSKAISNAGKSISNTVDNIGNAAENVGNAVSGGLKSVFGW